MSTLSVTTITGANTIKSGTASTPPTIQDSAGTQVGTFCRAWVNFNGTGTVAIRASFNVTSITDNGTGDYTVNFTNALTDANYSTVVTTTMQNGNTNIISGGIRTANDVDATTYTTSAVRISTVYAASGNGYTDRTVITVAVFR